MHFKVDYYDRSDASVTPIHFYSFNTKAKNIRELIDLFVPGSNYRITPPEVEDYQLETDTIYVKITPIKKNEI